MILISRVIRAKRLIEPAGNACKRARTASAVRTDRLTGKDLGAACGAVADGSSRRRRAAPWTESSCAGQKGAARHAMLGFVCLRAEKFGRSRVRIRARRLRARRFRLKRGRKRTRRVGMRRAKVRRRSWRNSRRAWRIGRRVATRALKTLVEV